MIFDIYSIIGWGGTILIILAYLLLATKKLKFNSVIYNLLNIFGGAGLVVSTFMTKSWPAFALNIIWIGIAGYSIYKKLNTKPIPYKELR